MDLNLTKSSEFQVEALTPRELDILALLAQNLSNREIAQGLTLALSTVKWYARQIYAKLEVDNRRQAVVKANRLKLLVSRNKTSPPAHNLPRQLTRFIGREKEIVQVVEWIWKYPLITLTGPGGVGKTRLALAVANELLEDFKDGAWLVELASLSDPKQVLRIIANVVAIHEEPGHTLLDSLTYFFTDRQALMILDNCEHLVDECARVVNGLLQSVPGLKLLATSREPLGVEGERIFRVPSLQFPPTHNAGRPGQFLPDQSIEELLGYESVELFLDRAQVVLPEFEITPQNIAPVVQICQRLDGIPLAIELAASRTVSLDVDQIASRLEHDFRMLAGGSRTAVERQRTLRATIEWSYNLLSENEQSLLRSLAVFSGGWTLPAAEAVCANEMIPQSEVLDLLTKLMNKSVILVDRQPGKDTRYRLLDSIRHFAAEKLSESGESETLRGRHCDWFIKLAETAEPKFNSHEALTWLKKLKPDHDNLRAALEWSVGENWNPEAGLRILIALSRQYWEVYGDYNEGYQWLKQGMAALESQAALEPLFKVKILINMTSFWSNPLEEIPRVEQIVRLCNDLGTPARMIQAQALSLLGWLEAFGLGNLRNGLLHLNEAETILRSTGPEAARDLATVMWQKIWVLTRLNDQPGEQACAEEYKALYQEMGDSLDQAHKILGDIALRQGEFALSTRHFNEHVALCRERGSNGIDIADTTRKLAEVERVQGRYEQALAYYRVSLKMMVDFGSRDGISWLLACVAFNQIAISQNQPPVGAFTSLRWAARILGTVQALAERIGSPLPVPVEILPEYERALAFLKENLDPGALQSASEEGRSMKVSQAVAYAMEDVRYPVSV